MAEKADHRQCPTRADGVVPLIAHWIQPATCLERQRKNYHKCFLCLYRGKGADLRLPVSSPPPPGRTLREIGPLDVSEAV